MKDSWNIYKLGLIDFWYYDEAEFILQDGKLLLTGNNGAGKSLTMQSFIPFLLDGNMKPERLDPFRSRDKQMINYLLEEDSPLEERTAYLYLECKRKHTEEYLSLGVGLRARRHQGVDSWFFILPGPTRVGEKFPLYRKEAGVKHSLTKKQLENQIKGKGYFIEKQGEYRKRVNELLFGFEKDEEYKELLDLLIKIRSPKLSNEFKPTTMIEILNASLQTLSEEELRHGASIIERIDALKQNLEDLNREMKNLKKIRKNFQAYNENCILNRAEDYLAAQKAKEEALQLLEEGKKEREQLLEELEALEEKRRLLDIEEENLKKEKASLDRQDIFALREEKKELEEKEKKEKKNSQQKADNLERQEEQALNLRNKIVDLERKKETAWDHLQGYLEEMEETLEDYSFPDFAVMKSSILKEEDFYPNVHSKKIQEELLFLKEGKQRLEACERAKRNFAEKLERLEETKREEEKEALQEEKWERVFLEMKEECIQNMQAWKAANTIFFLDEETETRFVHDLHRFDENSRSESLKELIYTSYLKGKNKLDTELVFAKVETEKKEKEKADLEKILKKLEEQKEAERERSPEQEELQRELEAAGIPYQVLYKYVNFAEGLSPEEKNHLEEALLSMGLLDALVLEEAEREKALDLAHSSFENYIFVESLETDARLSFGELSGNTSSRILEIGEYQLGILEGKISGEHKNIYIGAEEREAYRREQIRSLKQSIQEKEAECKLSREEVTILEEKIKRLGQEWKAFPSLDDVVEALREIQNCQSRRDKLQRQIEKEKEEHDLFRKRLEKEQQDFFHYAEKHRIPKRMETLEEKQEAFETYRSLYANVLHERERVLQAKENLCLFRDQEERTEDVISDLRIDLKNLAWSQEKIKQRLLAIREQLESEDVKVIEAKMESCLQRLDEIPKEKEKNTILQTQKKDGAVILERELPLRKKQLESSSLLELEKEKAFQVELRLGYCAKEGESPKDVLEKYRDCKRDEKVEEKLLNVYMEQQGDLSKYQLRMFYVADSEKRHDLSARLKGKALNFYALYDFLDKEVQSLQLLLKEKDEELFTDFLGQKINKAIRSRIRHSQEWVKRIDKIMQGISSGGSGLTFSLEWKAKAGETEEQLHSNDLIALLRKDILLLNEEDSEALSRHFHSKIDLARRRREDSDSHENFYQIVKEVLDYRQWFVFQLKFKKGGEERKKELTDKEFSKFSGGEKAMAMYIPLFSAAVAKYKGAREDAPKIIALDEAFAGIDHKNIDSLFHMMTELDFNYILTSQALWGAYKSSDSLAIYQLLRYNNAKFVTSIAYKWNGKEILEEKEGE